MVGKSEGKRPLGKAKSLMVGKILKWILRIVDLDWICLEQYRNQWRAVKKTAVKHLVL
jgi:hypothetical protein